MHIHIHIYIYIHIERERERYAYIHVYIYIYIYICVYIYTHAHIYTHIHTSARSEGWRSCASSCAWRRSPLPRLATRAAFALAKRAVRRAPSPPTESCPTKSP